SASQISRSERRPRRMRRIAPLLAALPVLLAGPALADGIGVRVTPPNKAQFLQFQGFDLRVEATASDPAGTVDSLKVTVDGADVTSRGVLDSGSSGKGKNWTFRGANLGYAGPRVVAATATGTLSGAAITGSGSSTLTIRAWDQSQKKVATRESDTFGPPRPAV